MATNEVTLPEGFVLDEAEAAPSLPEGFVLDSAIDTEEDGIQAEQEAFMERASDPLGGIGADTEGGAGISIGEAVRSAPFMAGIGQRFVRAGRGISQFFATKEEVDAIARANEAEQAELDAYLAKHPADRAAFNLGKALGIIGETATLARYIPSPSKVGITGRGIKSSLFRVGYSGAVGGGVAASEVTEPGESKGEQVAKGTAFGAVPASIVESLSMAARPVASLFITSRGARDSGGLLTPNPAFERGRRLERATGVRLTPGQVSGSIALSEMRPPKGFAEKQAHQTLRYFVKVRDQFTQQPKPAVELARKLDDVTDEIYRGLIETRRKVGDFRYSKFRNSVKEVFVDKLAAKMDELGAQAVPNTDEALVLSMRQQLAKQLDETGGVLTPQQLLGWQQRFNDLLAGKSDIFKNLSKANQQRLGKQLMDSLYDSLDETAAMLDRQGNLSPAALLKQAVLDYKKFSAPINELEESALGALFRSKGPTKLTPEAIARKLMQLEPSQVRGVYNVLARYNPSLIDEYRATKLYNAMQTSIKITPQTAGRLAGQTKFQPAAALKELTKKNGLRAVFEQDPKLLARVQRGIALLDRISDRVGVGAGGNQGLQSRSAEIAGNVFSGNPIFISRTAAKILGPVGLWKLTATEEGRQILRTLATAPLTSPKYTAAVENLVLNLDDASMQENAQ